MYPRDEFYTAYNGGLLPFFCGRKLFYSFNRQYFANEAQHDNGTHCRKINPKLISELRHIPVDPILTKADDTKKMTFTLVYLPIKEQYHAL